MVGVHVPDTFDIHHIDLNRDNNDINNLVALPKELHNQYHKLYPNQILDYELKWFKGSGFLTYNIDKLKAFIDIYTQCCYWVCYRDYLLWIIDQNIYNLSYNNGN